MRLRDFSLGRFCAALFGLLLLTGCIVRGIYDTPGDEPVPGPESARERIFGVIALPALVIAAGILAHKSRRERERPR